MHEDNNTVIVRKKARISVPVTLRPRICTKGAITYSYGEPVLIKRSCDCNICRNTGCSFVLSQNVCIEIPIEFSADAIVKEACIDCYMPDEVFIKEDK